MTTTIRLRRNGPYVIDSDEVRVIDWNGVEYTSARKPIALCRCGASSTKPFCDGTHSRMGFQAAEEAVRAETSGAPDATGEGKGPDAGDPTSGRR